MSLEHKILLWMYVLIPKRNEDRIGDAVYLIQILSGIIPLVVVILISLITDNYNKNPGVGVVLFIILELMLWRYIKKKYSNRTNYISLLNTTKKMNRITLFKIRIQGVLFFFTIVLFTMTLPLFIILFVKRIF